MVGWPPPPRTTKTRRPLRSSTPGSSLSGHFTELSPSNSSPRFCSCTFLFSLWLAMTPSPPPMSAAVSAFWALPGPSVEWSSFSFTAPLEFQASLVFFSCSVFFPFLSVYSVRLPFWLNHTGGHINPAVTFGLFLARKISLIRAVFYIMAQCLGAICGCALAKSFQKGYYVRYRGGTNILADGYSITTGLAAEIAGTFILVYTVFSATDPKRNARDSHVPVSQLVLSFVWVYHWTNFVSKFQGFGATPNWIRGVYSSFSHHSDHRHRHQPSSKLWSCSDL